MPPDESKLRQRRPHESEDELDRLSAQERISTLKDLKGTEVCIDGVIYDISDFEHPGGESFLIFGGNDVTVQYHMIHSCHTEKQLEKMKRVGTVADFECEYAFDTPFAREMKKEVFQIVRRGREFGTPGFLMRAAFYVALFFTLQYYWVTAGSSYLLAIVYGISQAFIGLNVQHDANHGAASRRPWINHILGLGADFIGGSKWLWMVQHWTHHSFTNNFKKDPDSFSSEPLLLFNDYPLGNPARKWMHRFQVLYFIPTLALYWASAVFNPQVFDLQQRGAQSIGIRMDNDYIAGRRKYAVLLRLLYFYVNVVTPFLHHGLSWLAFGHIMLMGVAGSLALAIPFSLSHNFEHVDRDPTGPVLKTGEKVCWYKTQVETSSTYGGFVAGCITGGLNFQIEHHLFPRMSSAWYPYIAPTVREVCKKHGVRYVYYPWIWQNFVSTLKYMHAAGTGAHWVKDPLSGKH